MSTLAAGRRGDFLSSVIERANERAPVVAPRPTSLFEPVAAPVSVATGFGDDDLGRDSATTDVVHGETHHRPRIRDERQPPNSVRPPPRAAGLDESIGESPTSQRQRMSASRPNDAVTDTEHARAPVAAERPAVAASPSIDMRPVKHAAAAIVPARPPDVYASRPVDRPPTPFDDDHDARNRDEARDTRHTASLLPQREIAASIARHAEATRESRQQSHETAAATPNVTISIGRLEVRAMQSSSPPPRQKNPRQPMRLDEYLQRKERAR